MLAPALTEAERYLPTIIAKAPVAFFALDSKGTFTLSEGRALEKLGARPGEFVGQSAFDRYRKYPHVLDEIRRALSGEEFSTVSELADRGLTFENHWAPVRDEDGRLIGTTGVSIDISDRRNDEKARREAETLYLSL
ncbi:MAG: PAS domain-containing protein, partial [Acidobacteria bacterium]|nr:PAS domain-containing protein [Acidobacteriota bacterium]